MGLSRFNAYEFDATIFCSDQGDYEGRVADGGTYNWPTIYGYPAWESAIGAVRVTASCIVYKSDHDNFRIRLKVDGHEFPECFFSEIEDLVEAYFDQRDKE
jgi:hypothetical protein